MPARKALKSPPQRAACAAPLAKRPTNAMTRPNLDMSEIPRILAQITRAIMPGKIATVKAAGLIRVNICRPLPSRLSRKREISMIGITLTADQIRNAPAPVRQWIEQQVSASLGPVPQAPSATPPQTAHLLACSAEHIAGILDHIRGVFPAVNVLFEFGRPGITYGQSKVMAFRLIDILHHTRLEDVGQVMTCLEMINQALTVVKGDPSARFCGFDNEGHCFIAPQTQASIATLWQTMLARRQAAQQGEAADQVAPAA
jgi:hypothetical protein